jgi:hypothetical protein
MLKRMMTSFLSSMRLFIHLGELDPKDILAVIYDGDLENERTSTFTQPLQFVASQFCEISFCCFKVLGIRTISLSSVLAGMAISSMLILTGELEAFLLPAA